MAERDQIEGAEDRAGRTGGASLEAAPGLARIALSAGLRTASWYSANAFRAGRRVTEAVVNGESPLELARDARDELIEGARRALGVTEIERRIEAPRGGGDAGDEPGSLRRRGERLLERSASLEAGSVAHPAFDRILTQFSPDEARILSLLAAEGPQAAVDVRTWRPLGIGSRVVAPGLTMIGKHGGCMRPERTTAYLANLYRLGLIWFSRDPVPRAIKIYQVLEAQPEVLAARQQGRTQIVRRSVRLTPFGRQFCDLCLPAEHRPAGEDEQPGADHASSEAAREGTGGA